MHKKQYSLFLIIIVAWVAESSAIFPINLFRFDNILLRPLTWQSNQFEFALLAEGAVHVDARDGNKVNVLQLWDTTQDALAMIRGFDQASELGQLAAQLNNANDDGVRGHLLAKAQLRASDIAFIARYYFLCDFYFSLYVPFYFMELKNISLEDQTHNTTFQDRLVRTLLTSNITNLTKDFGNLSVSPWQRSGLGDIVATLGWGHNFPQQKPWLKNVYTELRGGFTLPTGKRADIDTLFSIPFGNDGALGLFAGGSLVLTWGCWARAGVDVQFLNLFSDTRTRRIKTAAGQSDLFFLAKTDVQRDFGLTQEYILFLEAHKFFRGLSFKIAYDYIRHNDDELTVVSNKFSNKIANTAKSLEDWTIHNFILVGEYDWRDECKRGTRLSLFAKIPFNGRRSIQATTLGAEFTYSF